MKRCEKCNARLEDGTLHREVTDHGVFYVCPYCGCVDFVETYFCERCGAEYQGEEQSTYGLCAACEEEIQNEFLAFMSRYKDNERDMLDWAFFYGNLEDALIKYEKRQEGKNESV